MGGLFVKTRLDYFVFVNGHPLNVRPKALVLNLVKTLYLLLIYLLADPRLAEALNSSTVVPLTGSARSAPKPLPISKLLHSQHLSDDQPDWRPRRQDPARIFRCPSPSLAPRSNYSRFIGFDTFFSDK